MDTSRSNNEEELTSTITMGNLLSTTNQDEKSEASDSVPTSSTDAFTNASTSQIAPDDPISSTSSDIIEPKKFTDKPKMDTAISSDHNFSSSPIVSEKDLFDMNITDTSTERITENVDDLVQDLENLLGESTNASEFSTKTPVSVKASISTSTSDQLEISKLETANSFEEFKNDEKYVPAEEMVFSVTSEIATNEETCKGFIENADKKDVSDDTNLSLSATAETITDSLAKNNVNVETKIADVESDSLNTQDASKAESKNDVATNVEAAVLTDNRLDKIEEAAADNIFIVQPEASVQIVETVHVEDETQVQLTGNQRIVQETEQNAFEDLKTVSDNRLQEKTDLLQKDVNNIKEAETNVNNLELYEIKNENIEILNEATTDDHLQVQETVPHLAEDIPTVAELQENKDIGQENINYFDEEESRVVNLESDENRDFEIKSESITDYQLTIQDARPNYAKGISAGADLQEKTNLIQQDMNNIEDEESTVENQAIDEIKKNNFETPQEPIAVLENTQEMKEVQLNANVDNVEALEIKSENLEILDETETVIEVKEDVSNIQLDENTQSVSFMFENESQTEILPCVFEESLVVKKSELESQVSTEMELETNVRMLDEDLISKSKEKAVTSACSNRISQEVNVAIENFESEFNTTKTGEDIDSEIFSKNIAVVDTKVEVFDNESDQFLQTKLDTSSVVILDVEEPHETEHVDLPISGEGLPSESSSGCKLPEDLSEFEVIPQTNLIRGERFCVDDKEVAEEKIVSPNSDFRITDELSKESATSEEATGVDNSSHNRRGTDPNVEVDTTPLKSSKDKISENLISTALKCSLVETTANTENITLAEETTSQSSASAIINKIDTESELAINNMVDQSKCERTILPTKQLMSDSIDEVPEEDLSNSADSLEIERISRKGDLNIIEATSPKVVTKKHSQSEMEMELSNANIEIDLSGSETVSKKCNLNIPETIDNSGTELSIDDPVRCLQEAEKELPKSADSNTIDLDDKPGSFNEGINTGTIESQMFSILPVDSNAITVNQVTEKLDVNTMEVSTDSSLGILEDTMPCQRESQKESPNTVDSIEINAKDDSRPKLIIHDLQSGDTTNLGADYTSVVQPESSKVSETADTTAINLELVDITHKSANSVLETSEHSFANDNGSEIASASNVHTIDVTEDLSSKDVSSSECLDTNDEVIPVIIGDDLQSTSSYITFSDSAQILDDSNDEADLNFHLVLSEDSNETTNKDVIDENHDMASIVLDDGAPTTSHIISDIGILSLVEETNTRSVDDIQSPDASDNVTIFKGETVDHSLQSSDITASQLEPSVSNDQFETASAVMQSSDVTDTLNIDLSSLNEEAQEPVSCSNREDSSELEAEPSETISCSGVFKNKLTFTKEQINNDENLETLLAVASLSSSYQASFEEFMFEKQNYEPLDEVGTFDKTPDVSSTVLDEKIEDSKLNEPLVINIDDSHKDRISDTKATVKSLRPTEEDHDEPEGSKGTLKMTITKQSDTMHSILKIYQPGDSTIDESEPNVTTEQTVPKLIIKPVMPSNEQLESPKSGGKFKHVPGSSGVSPRITIKPIVKPESVVETISPLKITIKPVLKQEDITRQKQSPKLIIKPILKPEEEPSTESRVHSPRITIKPIVKPPDECEITPKITIKPIIEPPAQTTPKITIKPVLKPQDTPDQCFSPKITIKPIIKPSESSGVFAIDDSNEDSSAKERIVLKINKGQLPTPSTTSAQAPLVPTILGKDTKKREIQVEKIKLKFSKEGGHPHIVQNEFPNKRLKTDDDSTNITITPMLPTHSRIRELLTAGRTDYSPMRPIDDDDDVRMVEVGEKKTSPIVISEESTQDTMLNLGIDLSDPLSEIPVFAITPDSVKTLNPTNILKSSPSSQEITTPPTPRKRGRPRKVPLQVREDFKDPKEEEPKPVVIESTRPKRSCRGPSVRMTLGIKPRKPRGPGRGRGSKRGMGTRNLTATRDPSPIPAKEPRLSLKQQLKEDNQHTLLIGDKIEAVRSGIEIDDGFYKSPISSSSQLMPPQSDNSTSDRADIVMYEEETRMSAEISSRAQTPAKQVITSTPSADIVEESQSSVQSTATTESTKGRKGPRLEVHQEPEGAVISADQLAEYYWSGGGPYMLQEQVAQFLGIKSFKRKYPNIPRRIVDMQERDFIRESGLAGEAMCDLGLTSVNSADILDIMYSDFQDKYEEYCKHQRDRQAKDLINKQKALSLAAMQEKTKLDITQQAVQSAANWNATFNKTRREQRKACMDLQTLTVHYPKGKVKQINGPKIGNYPISLVPGQFTDYYGEFTPTELNNLPLNTMCYNPIVRARDLDCDSQTDGSGSESDTSSSGSDSSDSSSDAEDCTLCKPPPRKIVAAVQ